MRINPPSFSFSSLKDWSNGTRHTSESEKHNLALAGDLILAIALCVIGVVWLESNAGSVGTIAKQNNGALAMLLVAMQSLPLVGRRWFPRLTLALVATGTVLYGVSGYTPSPIDLGELLALYTAASYSPALPAWSMAAGCSVGTIIVSITSPYWAGSTETFAVILVLCLVAVAGMNQRLRSLRLDETAARAAELEQSRSERDALAAAEERLRLAQELHDVVGHALSVVLLHAGIARLALDQDPTRVRRAIAVIEERGRAAMEEMQRLLGVLHSGGAAAVAPLPTLSELGGLTSEFTEAGIVVTLQHEGEVRPLPVGIEVSAYRIVQEALTNTLRHSGACNASIRICYEPSALQIEALDDGSGHPKLPSGKRVGRGLLGMRERAMRLGGILEAGPRPSGGFMVKAWLPLNEAVLSDKTKQSDR